MDYRIDGKYDIRAVCWAINGYTVADGKLLPGYAKLGADGSTACGMWIYSGYYNNEAEKLDPMKQPLARRSKSDTKGRPWNPDKVFVEWKDGKWIQNDVGDFNTAKGPDNNAFFMTWEQNARLFAYPMADGPMPEHFEPFESPAKNLLNNAEQNPCALFTDDKSTKRGTKEEFPYVVTTYSVTEHWQTGTQTRCIPWLNELIS